jgi:hypothetical protein
MTPEAQRIAIAEWCGWRWWHDDTETLLLPPNSNWPSYPHWKARGMESGDGRPASPLADASGLPDYLNDLNDMHEAETRLDTVQRSYYWTHLASACNDAARKAHNFELVSAFYQCHATAAQRAEALLRTIGKWGE